MEEKRFCFFVFNNWMPENAGFLALKDKKSAKKGCSLTTALEKRERCRYFIRARRKGGSSFFMLAKSGEMMRILIVDGQGGGVGRQLAAQIKETFPDVQLMAVGTNTIATSAMLKGGADSAATGENAVLVAARKADVIVGPLGIVVADSLGGEISPAMANAVAQSDAKRILIPFKNCENVIVGVSDYTLGRLIQQAVDELRKIIA